MTPSDIIAAARSQLGVRFQHQGRVPGLALDCSGLCVAVAQSLGFEVVDLAGYGRNPANGQLEAMLDAQPFLVRVTDRKPGDILLMRFTGEPQHLAIYAEGTIIHSYETIGKVCEHDLTPQWARRIVRAYRFDGVSHE